MGADYYQPFTERKSECEKGTVPMGIGTNSTIRGAIVDKNAHIGCDVQIINKDRIEEAEREDLGFYIRSGVIVITKNAVIPDGMII